ncbi:MAG: hypothetical protein RL386_36, partial [Bacteroidota bacterium]
NQTASARQVFLVHGIPTAQRNFRGLLLQAGFKDVQIPELGETFNLTNK